VKQASLVVLASLKDSLQASRGGAPWVARGDVLVAVRGEELSNVHDELPEVLKRRLKRWQGLSGPDIGAEVFRVPSYEVLAVVAAAAAAAAGVVQ
jgi:hypothetical protein